MDGNGPSLFGTHPITAPLLLYMQGVVERRAGQPAPVMPVGAAKTAGKEGGKSGWRGGGKGGGKDGGKGGMSVVNEADEGDYDSSLGPWLDTTLNTTTLPEAWRERVIAQTQAQAQVSPLSLFESDGFVV